MWELLKSAYYWKIKWFFLQLQIWKSNNSRIRKLLWFSWISRFSQSSCLGTIWKALWDLFSPQIQTQYLRVSGSSVVSYTEFKGKMFCRRKIYIRKSQLCYHSACLLPVCDHGIFLSSEQVAVLIEVMFWLSSTVISVTPVFPESTEILCWVTHL